MSRPFALVGVAFREVGKGGNGLSKFIDSSGDGGAFDKGIGLVALLAILNGGLGDSGEGLNELL